MSRRCSSATPVCECVCVCVWKREKDWERERERERECVCVCMCVCVSVCVCVCVYTSGRGLFLRCTIRLHPTQFRALSYQFSDHFILSPYQSFPRVSVCPCSERVKPPLLPPPPPPPPPNALPYHLLQIFLPTLKTVKRLAQPLQRGTEGVTEKKKKERERQREILYKEKEGNKQSTSNCRLIFTPKHFSFPPACRYFSFTLFHFLKTFLIFFLFFFFSFFF